MIRANNDRGIKWEPVSPWWGTLLLKSAAFPRWSANESFWKSLGISTWDFDIKTHIQGTTMWSLTSRAFRKCGSFWASEFLNGSYRCSKLTDCEILGPLQKIRGVKKKRHGHNNEIWGLKRIAGPPNHVRRPCYSFQTSNLVIVAVSFFLNASIPAIFFSEFDLTLTADNYGLKPLNLENYHIFGRLWTCPFTWYHPR